MVTLVDLPLLDNSLVNFLNSGLWFLAGLAEKYKAFRGLDEPIFEIEVLPFTDVPEVLRLGVSPA